jgi:hypothetical protein
VGDDPFVPVANSSAHGIQINNIGKTSVILLAVFSGLSLGIAVGSLLFMVAQNHTLSLQVRDAETEVRLLEYYIQELDGKLIRSGAIDFSDSLSAHKQRENSK